MYKRNAGLDLLRMTAMLMVVVLHVLGQGGVMVRTGSNDASYFACYFLETACLCAVNCYGLLSGYVGVHARFSPRKLAGMILTVEFYSVLIGLALGLTHRPWLDRDVWLGIWLPVQWKTWWYYSAYVGLYLLMPFLNRGVAGLKRREKGNLLSVIFLVFCVGTMFAKAFSVDFFSLVGGYSLIWLIILYVFGAALRLLEDESRGRDTAPQLAGDEGIPGRTASATLRDGGERNHAVLRTGSDSNHIVSDRENRPVLRTHDGGNRLSDLAENGQGEETDGGGGQDRKTDENRESVWERAAHLRMPALALIFLGSTALAWGWKVLSDLHVITVPGDSQLQRMLLIYHSPTIFINALALLLIFRQLPIQADIFRKVIALFSPSAFYVYIIHTHPLIWEHVLKGALAGWRYLPAPLVWLPVLALALGIYLACSAIDLGRRQLLSAAALLNKHRRENP